MTRTPQKSRAMDTECQGRQAQGHQSAGRAQSPCGGPSGAEWGVYTGGTGWALVGEEPKRRSEAREWGVKWHAEESGLHPGDSGDHRRAVRREGKGPDMHAGKTPLPLGLLITSKAGEKAGVASQLRVTEAGSKAKAVGQGGDQARRACQI